MNPTISNHIVSRRLEERAADDAEVQGFWNKAMTALSDAANAGSSLENRLLRAYDAARLAAFAIVRSSGYRTLGTESHHFVTFEVARSLAADPGLRSALATVNGLRRVRHAVEYEACDSTDEPTVATAIQLAQQVMRLGSELIHAQRPHLILPSPPGAQ